MNKHIISILFFLLTFLTASRGQSDKNSSRTKYSLPIDTAFVPTDSNQFYFPLEVFHDTSLYVGHDTFVNRWYSQHLFAMREPVFYADKTQKEIYRFTWLRTFDNPVAIRIEKNDEAYTLHWKLCNGAGGYQPGLLTIDKQKVIDKTTWEAFRNHIAQIDFWNLETNKKTMGTDGSQWILEGKTPSRYHVVDRWTPLEKSKYYQCCAFLIGLTDLNVKGNDRY